MRAVTKVILSSRVTVDRKVVRHPVATFAKEADAKSYAGLIATAHKSGNVEFAKALDEQTAVDAEGKLIPGIKFDLVTVPYNPTPGAESDDLFGEDNSKTE